MKTMTLLVIILCLLSIGCSNVVENEMVVTNIEKSKRVNDHWHVIVTARGQVATGLKEWEERKFMAIKGAFLIGDTLVVANKHRRVESVDSAYHKFVY